MAASMSTDPSTSDRTTVAHALPRLDDVGVVAIGRNEGDRLQRCLSSLDGMRAAVYVDSGSTDHSVELATAAGLDVVVLDSAEPLSAARARNAGFQRLLKRNPQIRYVMFVDGDCELADGWLETGRNALERHPDWGVVFGRLHERSPETSIYNRLCALEWHVPLGETAACGGNAMIRSAAFEQAGGFNDSLAAGEEPELCVRLRQQGWKIHCIDAEMAVHDAGMTRFGEWWRRSVRAGYAFALGAWLHGRSPERHYVRESRSIWFWALILPALLLLTAVPTGGDSLWGFIVYGLLFVRITLARRSRMGDPWRFAALYAAFCVLGKFPQLVGQLRFWLDRSLRGRDMPGT